MIELNPKLVEFSTPDSLVLQAFIFEPVKPTKKALILLHGNGSSSILGVLQKTEMISKSLNENGITYFAMNNRGAGLLSKVDRVVDGIEDSVSYGMAYELIKECVLDIDGAVAYLQGRGYEEISLVGFSTGANKICVYNYYKPENPIHKYVLACGGDDTGIYYDEWGDEFFMQILEVAKQKVVSGASRELSLELAATGQVMSYQSILDTCDPDGDYNTFPYYETLNNQRLGTKELFREFASIKKPSLVVYGDIDEYCYGQVPRIIEILKGKTARPEDFEFKIIKGADHGFTGKEAELNRAITDFLNA